MNTRTTYTTTESSGWANRRTNNNEDKTIDATKYFAYRDEEQDTFGPTEQSTRLHRSSITNFPTSAFALATSEKGSSGGRLIVVSNRVALPRDVRAGGLASALKGALAEQGGIWFGWSGEVSAQPRFDVQADPVHPIRYATLDLEREDYEDYYAGFANRVLWPLFHYRLHLLDFHRETLAAYRRVSAKFAERLVDMIAPEDTIWVHDYHLIPLGAALRSRGVGSRIGFFLHTPFPPPELMQSLPHHRDLMSAFSAYDLVGFQTDTDKESFVNYCVRELNASIEDGGDRIRIDRHTFRVGTFPVSIDTAHIQALGQRAANSTAVKRLQESLDDRTLLVGVDRLDYSKGLPERFESFARLLKRYPDLQRSVMLLQIAPPSREDLPEYRKLRHDLEKIAGSINSEFADPDWTPIRYVNKSYQHASLAGFYRCARVGLVTPFRDGMNLVAKEYVASQDAENPGVLVLSRFAGAAQELTEALLVNPFDGDQMVEALRQALIMPLGERKRRWQHMMEHLRSNDVTKWRKRFLGALRDSVAAQADAAPADRSAQSGMA